MLINNLELESMQFFNRPAKKKFIHMLQTTTDSMRALLSLSDLDEANLTFSESDSPSEPIPVKKKKNEFNTKKI